VADTTPNSVYYELWENRSGNLLAEFDTEDEALRFVRDRLKGGDFAAVLSWSLHRSNQAVPIAYGKALYALVDKHMPV
jgi:hypothetical protein